MKLSRIQTTGLLWFYHDVSRNVIVQPDTLLSAAKFIFALMNT